MSLQTSLDRYFKVTAANPVPVLAKVAKMNNKNKFKRRSLSLTRSSIPNKSPKTLSLSLPVSCELKTEEYDQLTPPPQRRRQEDSFGISTSQGSTQSTSSYNSMDSPNTSTNSSSTIIYSPSQYLNSPLKTPTKTPKSPGSSKKYFSPIKKRVVNKRSPAKRNLASQFMENNQQAITEKEVSSKYKDDKTLFLISLIDKYNRNDALKHLLEENSQVLLSNCLGVVEAGMRIVCRLYWRQPNWFNMEQLQEIASDKKKFSITNFQEVINSLLKHQLITLSLSGDGKSTLQFDDYVKLLKKPELLKVCQEYKIKVASKEGAVEELRKFSKRPSISMYGFGPLSQASNNRNRVLKSLQSYLGQCYKLTDNLRDALDRLHVIMYLGIDYSIIRDRKLELVLINDKINQETYPIDKNMVLDDASIVFQNKDQFNRYYNAHVHYENYITSTNLQEKCTLVVSAYQLYKDIEEQDMLRYKALPPWLRRFTPANIYVKIMESGVQELKKDKSQDNYLLAIDILNTLISQTAFRQHKREKWYEEKALIFHKHLNQAAQAANTVLEAFSTNLSEEAKDLLRPRAKLLANQGNITLDTSVRQALRNCGAQDHVLERNIPAEHVHKPPMDNYNQRGKLKFTTTTEDGRTTVSAEDYCVIHYNQNGQYTHGEHCEGRIVTSIYFLLFWDIIYTKPVGLSGIFMSYYQRHPLDMYLDSFYINRRTLIDDRLAFIEESTEDMLVEMMTDKWMERHESDISEVSRGAGIDVLVSVARCLGVRAVAAICRRLVRNYGYTHSGFPDLTLWNVHTKQVKFVEVKTDSDKPSMKQLQWLDYLISHNIPAGFCYVGVNTTRSKARARDSYASS